MGVIVIVDLWFFWFVIFELVIVVIYGKVKDEVKFLVEGCVFVVSLVLDICKMSVVFVCFWEIILFLYRFVEINVYNLKELVVYVGEEIFLWLF